MEMEEVCDRIDTLIDVNRETQQWLKVMAWGRVREMVESALGTKPANYELYDSLDGDVSVDELAASLAFSTRTAYRRLNEWQRIGIVTRVERGHYDKIASLDSLDIGVPEDGE